MYITNTFSLYPKLQFHSNVLVLAKDHIHSYYRSVWNGPKVMYLTRKVITTTIENAAKVAHALAQHKIASEL